MYLRSADCTVVKTCLSNSGYLLPQPYCVSTLLTSVLVGLQGVCSYFLDDCLVYHWMKVTSSSQFCSK